MLISAMKIVIKHNNDFNNIYQSSIIINRKLWTSKDHLIYNANKQHNLVHHLSQRLNHYKAIYQS